MYVFYIHILCLFSSGIFIIIIFSLFSFYFKLTKIVILCILIKLVVRKFRNLIEFGLQNSLRVASILFLSISVAFPLTRAGSQKKTPSSNKRPTIDRQIRINTECSIAVQNPALMRNLIII